MCVQPHVHESSSTAMQETLLDTHGCTATAAMQLTAKHDPAQNLHASCTITGMPCETHAPNRDCSACSNHQEADAVAENGRRWLRAIMHCMCCKERRAQNACRIGPCASVRRQLEHIYATPPTVCASSQCACLPLRQLQIHFCECTDLTCALCNPVYSDICERLSPATEPSRTAAGIGVTYSPVSTDETTCRQQSTPSANNARSRSNSGTGEDVSTDQALIEKSSNISSSLDMEIANTEEFKCPAAHVHQLVTYVQFLIHGFLRRPVDQDGCVLQDDKMAAWQGIGCKLWLHLLRDCQRTNDVPCHQPGCAQTRKLLHHLITCDDAECSVCIPAIDQFICTPKAGVVTPSRTIDDWLQDVAAAVQSLSL